MRRRYDNQGPGRSGHCGSKTLLPGDGIQELSGMIIDLHTHTFASDGVLLPSELVRRAVAAGYRAIGLTDHADETNMRDLLQRALTAAEVWSTQDRIKVLCPKCRREITLET